MKKWANKFCCHSNELNEEQRVLTFDMVFAH